MLWLCSFPQEGAAVPGKADDLPVPMRALPGPVNPPTGPDLQEEIAKVRATLEKEQTDLSPQALEKLAGQMGRTNYFHHALLWFVERGNTASVKALLAKYAGLDTNVRNAAGKTALHLANQRDDLALMELLLAHGADINAPDADGNTVLHHRMTASNDLVPVPRPPPDFFDRMGAKIRANKYLNRLIPLPPAKPPAAPPKRSVVTFLLDHKANPKAVNHLGQTPLHVLVSNRAFEGQSGNPWREKLNRLIRAGAKTDVLDGEGRTPLNQAIDAQNRSAFTNLLDFKVNLEARDGKGRTPLLFAMERDYDSIEWMRPLLQHGANPNVPRGDGLSPLHIAITNKFHPVEMVALLLTNAANPNLTDAQGRAPLHLAIKAGQHSTKMTELLLKHGADANAKLADGRTRCMLL